MINISKFKYKIKNISFINKTNLVYCKLKALGSNYFKRKEINRIHFLSIPKTGSTIVSSQLKIISKKKKIFFNYYNHYVKPNNLKKNTKYFITIRDPFKRLVSGFYQTIQNKSDNCDNANFYRKKGIDYFLSDLSLKSKRCSKLVDTSVHLRENFNTFYKTINMILIHPPVYIIEHECLEDDIKKLYYKFGVNFDINTLDNKLNFLNYKKDSISKKIAKKIKLTLAKEYEVYNHLKIYKKKINYKFLNG